MNIVFSEELGLFPHCTVDMSSTAYNVKQSPRQITEEHFVPESSNPVRGVSGYGNVALVMHFHGI